MDQSGLSPACGDPVAEAKRLLRLGNPPRGFFFDFDGVLATITEDPEAVEPVPEVLPVLRRLAQVVERVAIVSARSVSFLGARLPDLRGVDLFGLYGLESRLGDGELVTDPAAEQWSAAVGETSERARTELPPQLRVEHKRLSVALHYRPAPHLRSTVEAWAERVAAETGLRQQHGRMVVELMPPVDRNKGTVVDEETDGLASAWYFGDDVSDLAGFAALQRRAEEVPGFFGVRVAVMNPETGQPLRDAADLVVDSPRTVPELLSALVGELEAAPDRR
jgi:trehalose 6-phosphate phosphatase